MKKYILFLMVLIVGINCNGQNVCNVNADPMQRPCLPYWRDLMKETIDSVYELNCLLRNITPNWAEQPTYGSGGGGGFGVCSPYDPHYRPCNQYWDDLNYALNDSLGVTNNLLRNRTGGGIGGSGTINTIAKFTAGTTIGNSSISDDGSNTVIADGLNVEGNTNLNELVEMPNINQQPGLPTNDTVMLTRDPATDLVLLVPIRAAIAAYIPASLQAGRGIGISSNTIYADSTIVAYYKNSIKFTGIDTFTQTPIVTGAGISLAHGANISIGTIDAFDVLIKTNAVNRLDISSQNGTTLGAVGSNLNLVDNSNTSHLQITNSQIQFAPNGSAYAWVITSGTGAGNFVAGATNNIQAVSTNNSAIAGNIGDFQSITLVQANKISLTTGVIIAVDSLSLTAGNWESSTTGDYDIAGATLTHIKFGLSLSSTSFGGQDSYHEDQYSLVAITGSITTSSPTIDLKFSATTKIYLLAEADFSVGTVSAYGSLRGIRPR